MIIDAANLPDPADLPLLLAVMRTGGFAFDETPETRDALIRLKAKGLASSTTNKAGTRYFGTNQGAMACVALTGNCPDEQEPGDMTPFLRGGK